jgi:hypothetical protein
VRVVQRAPAPPLPPFPKAAPRLAAPPIQAKPAPPPRLQPPPLPPVRQPVQPKVAPPSRLPAPPPPPRRTPPSPAPPLPGATVAQGVIVKKKGGDELDDHEVEAKIKHYGLQQAGARYVRTVQKGKVRRVLGTVIKMALLKDKTASKGKKKAAKGGIKKPATMRARRIKGFSKVGIDRTFKKTTVATSVTFKGRWTEKVTLSGARSFYGRRDAQVLRHLSAQLFWYVRNKLGQGGEQEVQAMAVNNRILIAANNDSSVEALAVDLAKGGKGHLRKLLSQQQENDERSRGNAKKLSKLFEGKRKFPGFEGVESLIAIAANDAFGKVDVSDQSGCTEAILSPTHSQKLILIVGSGDLHAEQKLVLALYQAKRAGATIYGKKRPCATCAATLRFANDKLKLNITHNLHHGGYWGTANEGLLRLVRLAVDRNAISGEDAKEWLDDEFEVDSYQTLTLKKKVKRKSLKTETVDFDEDNFEETGYDSASDSEADD